MDRPMPGGPSGPPPMNRPPSPMGGGLPMPGGMPTPPMPPMAPPMGAGMGMAPLQQFISTLIAAMPHLMALQQMAQRQAAPAMGAPMNPVGAQVAPRGPMLPPGL